MDLQVKYGSFLRKSELGEAKYEYSKPLIRKRAICCFAFAAGFALTLVGANMYAKMMAPVKPYDTAYFTKAQLLSTDVSKGLAKIREARPNEIDVCKVVQEFTNKPNDVELETISIVPNRYVIKGMTRNVNSPNEYLNMLDFGKKHKAISDISTNIDGNTQFTITVVADKKGGKK